MCKVCDELFKQISIHPDTKARVDLGAVDLAFDRFFESFAIECFNSNGDFEENVIINYCPFCGCNLEHKAEEILFEVVDNVQGM